MRLPLFYGIDKTAARVAETVKNFFVAKAQWKRMLSTYPGRTDFGKILLERKDRWTDEFKRSHHAWSAAWRSSGVPLPG